MPTPSHVDHARMTFITAISTSHVKWQVLINQNIDDEWTSENMKTAQRGDNDLRPIFA